MAKTNAINILIKLLGGQEMTAELQKLGTTGEAAIKKISDSAKKVELANLGTAVNDLGGSLKTVVERVALGVGALVAAATAAAPVVLTLAKAGAEAADQAGKAAQAAGMQAKTYQELAFAAEGAGVSATQFGTALSTFNKQIVGAADSATRAVTKNGKTIASSLAQSNRQITEGFGFTIEKFNDIGVEVLRTSDKVKTVAKATGTAAEAFNKLGISIRDQSGNLKSNEQLLLEVASAFQKMPDGAQKSALAIALFGKEGAKLIPLLNQGAAGIADLAKQADELGVVFSDQQIKQAADFNDALTNLGKAANAVRYQIGLVFVPALTAAANAWREAIVRNRQAIVDFTQNAVKIATVYVKDFAAALSGRDADVTNRWILDWRDAIVGFGKDVYDVITSVIIPAFDTLHKAVQLVTEAINAVFKTNVTAGEVLVTASLIKLAGGFGLLRSAVALATEAIIFFSRALVSYIIANPAVAALALLAGAILTLAERQQNAKSSADQHKQALDALDTAINHVKAGVPGAQEALKQLAQADIDAAKAALLNAQAQVERAKQVLAAAQESQAASKVGALEQRLGQDVDPAMDELVRAEINLAKQSRQLQELQDKIASGAKSSVQDLASTAKAAIDTTVAAAQTAEQSTIAVLHSSASGGFVKDIYSLSNGIVTGVQKSQDALGQLGASATKVGQTVKRAADDVSNSFRQVPQAAAGTQPLKPLEDSADQTASKFQEVGQAATQAGQTVQQAAPAAGQAWTKAGDQAKQSLTELPTVAKTAVDGVQTQIDRLNQSIQSVGSVASTAPAPGAQEQGQEAAKGGQGGIASVFDQIKQTVSDTVDQVIAALAKIQPAAQDAFNGLGQLASTAAESILTAFDGLSGSVESVFAAIVVGIQSEFNSLRMAVNDMVTLLTAQLNRLRDAIASAKAQASSSSSSDSGSSDFSFKFAGGGGVFGPGSSKSDSILARLSNGEFVLRAEAVRKFGLPFLNAMNALKFPGFADGGFLGGVLPNIASAFSIPSYLRSFPSALSSATLSPALSGRPINLNLPGGQSFQMIAENDVAERLASYLRGRSFASLGASPSWQGKR